MKKIAVFCGAFNPPLISHFSLATQILNLDNEIEKIIFVPVSTKYNKRDLIDDKYRYNMLKIECDKNDKFEVSDIELNNNSQAYTIETMRKLQEIYNNYKLYLVIGTDNLRTFDTWHLAEALLNEFNLIVLKRDNDNIDDIINNSILLKKYKNNIIRFENIIQINLCSTIIRKQLQVGKKVKYLIPEDILNYIKKEGIYLIREST